MALITKDMTIADVLRQDRTTAPVFMRYGMYCLGCPVSTGESVAEAASVHGVDADELVQALNDHLKDK
jgi:hybrid cluster-associated redox disulfide protein